jgi:hypothetical protein
MYPSNVITPLKSLLAQMPVGSGSRKGENDLQGYWLEHGFRTRYDEALIISALATELQKEISSRRTIEEVEVSSAFASVSVGETQGVILAAIDRAEFPEWLAQEVNHCCNN